MYNINDASRVSKLLNISFDKFSIFDLLRGMNVELEHGSITPNTNVTDNNLIKTAKIALAHLNEFPNYYNKDYGIINFENSLKEKYRN